jgi:hypothetical protein
MFGFSFTLQQFANSHFALIQFRIFIWQQVARAMLVLPHSTHMVQHFFSRFNSWKPTGKSNNVERTILRGRIFTAQLARRSGGCHELVIPPEVVRDIVDGTCYKKFQRMVEQSVPVKKETTTTAAGETVNREKVLGGLLDAGWRLPVAARAVRKRDAC